MLLMTIQDMLYLKKSNEKAPDNSALVSAEASISPCKKLKMRTTCIEQLDKWHRLLAKGAIYPASGEDHV